MKTRQALTHEGMQKALQMVDEECFELCGVTYNTGAPQWQNAALSVIRNLDSMLTNSIKAHILADRERQEAREEVARLQKQVCNLQTRINQHETKTS